MVTGTPQRSKRPWAVSDGIAVLALAVSLVSAGVAVFQTQRANDISDGAYALSRSLAPATDIYVNVVWASLVEDEGKPAIKMELELVNTGEVALSGCGTYVQSSDADGKPIRYWPSIVEPGGALWGLAPAEKHPASAIVPLSSIQSDSAASKVYVAIWFECVSADLVTLGHLFGVDVAAQNLIAENYLATADGEVHSPLKQLDPLGSYERFAIVERDSGRTPPPSPIPSPRFTVRAETPRA